MLLCVQDQINIGINLDNPQNKINLQADKALEVLARCSHRDAVYARVVALRSKGLILREQNKYDDAIACHTQALVLLRPVGSQARARLETVLNLAE